MSSTSTLVSSNARGYRLEIPPTPEGARETSADRHQIDVCCPASESIRDTVTRVCAFSAFGNVEPPNGGSPYRGVFDHVHSSRCEPLTPSVIPRLSENSLGEAEDHEPLAASLRQESRLPRPRAPSTLGSQILSDPDSLPIQLSPNRPQKRSFTSFPRFQGPSSLRGLTRQ